MCVADQCGNETCEDYTLIVEDRVSPTAACDDQLNITINNGDAASGVEGVAAISAEDVDEGSNDNCDTDVFLEISRTGEDGSWVAEDATDPYILLHLWRMLEQLFMFICVLLTMLVTRISAGLKSCPKTSATLSAKTFHLWKCCAMSCHWISWGYCGLCSRPSGHGSLMFQRCLQWVATTPLAMITAGQ
ncbi:MAG: hypothetical protein R2795_08915 [Saprospiraceae bacterium]